MEVVQDVDLKQSLRDSGIKVAADLTRRQRAEVDRVRAQGKFAYFKNGRLHVEERRTQWDGQQKSRQQAERDVSVGCSRQEPQQLQTTADNDSNDPSGEGEEASDLRRSSESFETAPRPMEIPAAEGQIIRNGTEVRGRKESVVVQDKQQVRRDSHGGTTNRDRRDSRALAQPLMSEVLQRPVINTRSGRGGGGRGTGRGGGGDSGGSGGRNGR